MNEKFKLLMATDVHLNFVHEEKIKSFCKHINDAKPDAMVITGDIAEAQNVVYYLGLLHEYTKPSVFPIFFVLGNHDYYNSSFKEVRDTMEKLFTYQHKGIKIPQIGKGNKNKRLIWLNSSGVIPLTKDTCLVGADGFYDGQHGNFFFSKVDLNDYHVIQDLSWPVCQNKHDRHKKINEIAQHDAKIIGENIRTAFKDCKAQKVFVATHVSPFQENSVYNGKQSDEHWMPHFSCKAIGDELLACAIENPDKEIIVLCGHSHGTIEVKHMPNLICFTGAARYRFPDIARIWETD
jgi:Icc-related predicted phosphoesterase